MNFIKVKYELLSMHHNNLHKARTNLDPIKIITKENITLNNEKIKFSSIDKRKGITFPDQMTTELAEEIGIHLGDGFLSSNKADYRVKGHKIDEKDYYDKFIGPLMKRIYNLDVNIKNYSDTYGFEVYSQALSSFKINVLKIKPGRKDDIKVPEIILNGDINIITAFLRGIFDTDCNLNFASKYGYKSYYPNISIYQSSEYLIKDLKYLLDLLSLRPSIYKDKRYKGFTISLYGYNRFLRYIQLIGFNNEKHLKKVRKWKVMYPELSKKVERVGGIEPPSQDNCFHD